MLHAANEQKDDGEEEVVGLLRVLPITVDHDRRNQADTENFCVKNARVCSLNIGIAIIVAGFYIYGIMCGGNYSTSSPLTLRKNHPSRQHSSLFQCPVTTERNDNLYDYMKTEYEEEAEQFSSNRTEFLNTFRGQKFDQWSSTYEQRKRDVLEFKTKYFVPYLKRGSRIFESACGIGLNLYMTLEIANEVSGVDDITVYGNEYVDVSARKANIIYDYMPPTPHTKKGQICTGDSMNLEFVPSNAFDLVFTGYVTPRLDPLGLAHEEESGENGFSFYYKMCKDKDTDWKSRKLNELAQEKNEDWFATWVGEMIRIAKPGAPIIVEQVQLPFCKPQPFPGEGGVKRIWWRTAVDKYHWDVDPNSIQLENALNGDHIHSRYNVFMLKNK